MEYLISKLSVYMIPPLLCLIAGITLAVLSVARGGFKKENILFSLVCIWWSLLPPVFISHFFISDIGTIMTIERSVHFFYVFVPFINIIFFHRLLGIRRNRLELASFGLSALCAAMTPTSLYFVGLYKFSWGYIARGGPFFPVVGIYALAALIYCVIITYNRMREEKNEVARLKIQYIIYSFILTGVLTIMNIPAINGIDFYPAGNFMFIPLSILGYGILRYRLMEIRSIMHVTLIWGVLSSLVLIPNVLIYYLLEPWFEKAGRVVLFFFMVIWFFSNYYYFRTIQPLINRIFNRHNFNLHRIELRFVEQMALLKNLTQSVREFVDVLRETLGLPSVDFFLKIGETKIYRDAGGRDIEIHPDIEEWFVGANHTAEKNMVETNPYYALIREKLLFLFDRFGCLNIVPLVHNNILIGICFLPEKVNLNPLTSDEISFINNIRATTSIALSNSMMYQNLSNMKDKLEVMVEDRTKELRTKNNQMLFELKVAKNVQKAILPARFPYGDRIRIATRIVPLMEVSGDFYEVVDLGRERMAVAIIDVSGHGVPSALLTSMIKSAIDDQLKTVRPTAEICASINRTLTPTLLETGFYFTMFLAILDLARMEMEYTNCGHTEPLLLSAEGKFADLATEGYIVGATLEAVYDSRKAALHPGDRIVLYTDGITEARNIHKDFYGVERFRYNLISTLKDPVGSQLNSIVSSVDRFQAGAERKDDLSLMLIEIGGDTADISSLKTAIMLYNEKKYQKVIDLLVPSDEGGMDPTAHYILARSFLMTGKPERALTSIQKAIAGGPDRKEYLYLKGQVFSRMGRNLDALNAFQRVYFLDSHYRKTVQYIEKLNK